MIGHVMVAVGAFSSSLLTAKYAIVLAKQLGAKLTAVHVINRKVLQDLLRNRVFIEEEAQRYERDLEEQGELMMEKLKKMAEEKGVKLVPLILHGEVNAELARAVREEEADILVMGELKEIFSMSDVFYDEGERLFRRVSCPVLVVKDPERVESLYRETK